MYDVIAHMALQQDLTDVPGTCLTGCGANLVIGRRVAQTTKKSKWQHTMSSNIQKQMNTTL